ncbi:Lanosterol 14-alpha-demethylase [Globomyces sp. JEL0801]|nr:Lanosterol 14-alpha-demethylase [Globomyces sp. JEL0801]
MGILTTFIQSLDSSEIYSIVFIGIISLVLYNVAFKSKADPNLPPMVPYTIPLVGSAIQYGINPIKFLEGCREKYGDCFTFLMFGRKLTFCLGSEGNYFVFNIPIANACAEGAYDILTVPVFGTEVVYDVPNSSRFVKDALTTQAFKKYVPLIWDEATEFFKTFKDNGEIDLFLQMSELTIRTASSCLMGKEIRAQLHSNVAQLYLDLDGGFSPLNYFFRWLPLPNYFARDRAQKIMTETFKKILDDRRASSDTENTDVLQALMDSTYKDGTKLSDNAIAHMMIAMLMGGQHTSSTTSSWILFEIARRPDVIDEIIKEQSQVLTGKADTPINQLPTFDYDQLRQMTYLDCVMKEALRLHAPIHTVMRKVIKDVNYNGLNIPSGHFLCGSAAVSAFDAKQFNDPETFNPSRWLNSTETQGEWTLNGVNISQKSAKSNFLPFGAGRHRCIGEAFAFLQIKTIIANFVRTFEHKLVQKSQTGEPIFPQPDYTSMIVIPQKKTPLAVKRREF